MKNNGGQKPVVGLTNGRSQKHHRGQTNVPGSVEYHPDLNHSANLRFTDWQRRRHMMTCVDICTKRASKSLTSGCLDPPSKGQKPPRSESPKNMKSGLRIPQSGHFTAKSAIGTINQNQIRGQMGEETRIWKSNLSLSISIFISFCLSLIFAASTITIATHNLHGFKKCSSYHRSCLQRHEGIWMGQELWLTERQLSTMSNLGTQFTARSAMEDAISSGIFRGRPFGGVSIAWSPKLNPFIRPLTNFRHKRVVGVEIDTESNKTLFISIYMPFFDASKREECMVDTIDAISMLETILDSHPLHSVIIGGDFNCELKGNSPFDPLWTNFAENYSLTSCDNFIPTRGTYTYSHDSLGQRKWNDHFLISKSLSGDTSNHFVLDEGDNPSDHLPLLFSLSTPLDTTPVPTSIDNKPAKFRWDKMTNEHRLQYENRLSSINDSTQFPLDSFKCTRRCHCTKQECKTMIQEEYDCLLSCLKHADAPLPRHKPGVEKDWWTPNLTHLRNQSIDIHRRWEAEGKPRQGLLHLERLRIRSSYKKAIRDAQRAPKQEAWNRLHSTMLSNDKDTFWKSWRTLYAKNKSSFPTVVDGHSSKSAIATSFQRNFEKNALPNNQQKVDDLNVKFQDAYSNLLSSHDGECNCSSYNVTLNEVIDAILCLKGGKSPDDDGISAEHFLYAPYSIIVRLQRLFLAMLAHSFVPLQFTHGSILPLVKDNHGNRSDVNNYRGITISPIASKIFEHLLKSMLSPYLQTDARQFGFKKKSSTLHAIYCLKETVNYYIDNGSRVFCAFLDASKAFDRLVHSGLFLKLMARGVPKVFLDLIIYWYSNLKYRVKWNDCFSD